MDRGAPVDRDLGGEVGRAAEAVHPEAATVGHRGALEGAVPDDPGAQEGRRLLVVERIGQRVRVGLVDDRELRVAPVVVPPGEARGHAQVLVPSSAEPAGTAGVAEPRDADAIAQGETGRTDAARHHAADDLVAGHDRRPAGREVALGHVQIGAADAAHGHLHQHLGRRRFGHGALDRPQGPAIDGARLLDRPRPHAPCVHGASMLGSGDARSLPLDLK